MVTGQHSSGHETTIRHAGPMTAYRVVRFPNPIVPMKQFEQRKRLGRCDEE